MFYKTRFGFGRNSFEIGGQPTKNVKTPRSNVTTALTFWLNQYTEECGGIIVFHGRTEHS